MELSPIHRRKIRRLRRTIDDINNIIEYIHATQHDIPRVSLWQRLINDLDAARVTTRQLIDQLEHPNDYIRRSSD